MGDVDDERTVCAQVGCWATSGVKDDDDSVPAVQWYRHLHAIIRFCVSLGKRVCVLFIFVWVFSVLCVHVL